MTDRLNYNGVLFDLGNTLLPFGWDELSEFVTGWFSEASKIDDSISLDQFVEAYRSVIKEEWRIKRSRPWETNPGNRASMVTSWFKDHGLGGDNLENILAESHTPIFQSCLRFPDRTLKFLSDLRGSMGRAGDPIRIGLISNAADSKAIRNCLDSYGADRYFDAIVISEEEGEAKPWPGIFKKTLGMMEMDGTDCVYIGDRYKVDVLGARGVGMDGIYYREYETRGEPPEGSKIDSPVVRSLDQLNQILTR